MTYFSQVFRYNKWLCWLLGSFCALTILVNVLKIETTPFFIWGMYSEKEKSLAEYEIFTVVVNDSVTIDYSSNYTDANRFFLSSPLAYYIDIYRHAGKDPLEDFLKEKSGKYFDEINYFKGFIYNDSSRQMAFKKWYIAYLEETIHQKINKLDVNILHLKYNDEGQPVLQSKTKIAL